MNLIEFTGGELIAANDWTFFDLSSLGKVTSVYFTLNSTDTGAYGMNTAAYFCMDKFQVKGEDDPAELPAAPTINVDTAPNYITIGATSFDGADVIFYQCEDALGTNPVEIGNPTQFQREDEPYYVYVYAVAVNAAGETASTVVTIVVPAKEPGPTAIDEMIAGKAISSVRYFNMAGQEMPQAEGMTIVVTTYTDGTTTAVKVMK